MMCSVCAGDIDQQCDWEELKPRHDQALFMAKLLTRVCLVCVCTAGLSFQYDTDTNAIKMSRYIVDGRRRRQIKSIQKQRFPTCIQRQCLIDYCITLIAADHPLHIAFKYGLSEMVRCNGFNPFYVPASLMRKLRKEFGVKGLACYKRTFPQHDITKECLGTYRDAMMNPSKYQYRWVHKLVDLNFLSVPITKRLSLYKRRKKACRGTALGKQTRVIRAPHVY